MARSPLLLGRCTYSVRRTVITHTGIAAGVGKAFSRVCLFVCVSVCPRSKRKTACAIDTKLGTRILYSRGQKVKGQGHVVTKTVTVARLLVTMSRIPHTNMPLCGTCGRCRCGSACRYDCLCFLVQYAVRTDDGN